MKRIVIVTTSQPTANPRVVKEAIVLAKAGFRVTVIYSVTLSWADEMDKKIIEKNSTIKWVEAGRGLHNHNSLYRLARIRRKLFEVGFKVGLKRQFGDFASVIVGQTLYKCAKNIPADLYIAHNLGALPAAANSAQLYNSFYAFDAEDFHRGEAEEDSFHWKHSKFIEDKYFPGMVYLTTSSPLISQEYNILYPGLLTTTILNVFNSKEKIIKDTLQTKKEVIKLFWFSQKIGKGRGLEDVFNALQQLPKNKFSLTLLGYIEDEIKHYFEKLNINKCEINYLEPVDPYEIFEIGRNFDIGLALEPGRDLNNKIALSNKIFTYLSCGNAIVFSDTLSQASFYKCNPEIGLLYKSGDSKDLSEKLWAYIDNFELLFQHRKQSMLLGQEVYNWETESKKLVSLVKTVLN